MKKSKRRKGKWVRENGVSKIEKETRKQKKNWNENYKMINWYFKRRGSSQPDWFLTLQQSQHSRLPLQYPYQIGLPFLHPYSQFVVYPLELWIPSIQLAHQQPNSYMFCILRSDWAGCKREAHISPSLICHLSASLPLRSLLWFLLRSKLYLVW